MEYGSEYESSANDLYYTDTKQELPQGIYTRSGRDAFFLVAEDLHKYNVNTIYMPALCCPSMVDPFLHSGFKIKYYDIGDDFQGVLENESIKEEECILINNYFGKLSLPFQKIDSFKLQNPNSKVIFDFTHALLNYFKESCSLNNIDYCVASIRKWLYLPSGGYLFTEKPIEIYNSKDFGFANLRKQALQIKNRYLQNPEVRLRMSIADFLVKQNMNCKTIDSPNAISLIDPTSLEI